MSICWVELVVQFQEQEIGDALDGVVGAAFEHIALVGLPGEAVELRRTDQRAHPCGAVTAFDLHPIRG